MIRGIGAISSTNVIRKTKNKNVNNTNNNNQNVSFGMKIGSNLEAGLKGKFADVESIFAKLRAHKDPYTLDLISSDNYQYLVYFDSRMSVLKREGICPTGEDYSGFIHNKLNLLQMDSVLDWQCINLGRIKPEKKL